MNTFEVPQEIKNRIDMIADHIESIKSIERKEMLREDEADKNVPRWKVLQYGLYSMAMKDLFESVDVIKQTLEMKEEDFNEMAKRHNTSIEEMLHLVTVKMVTDLLNK
jgi:hypothetical protein